MNDDLSYTWKIVDLVLSGEIKAVASHKILNENKLIIQRNIVRESDRSRLEKFMVQVQVVPVHKRLKIIKDDPEDDKFIECADETSADYIISSDRHLLDLEKYKNTQILHPKDFWFKYSGQQSKNDGWKEIFKNILID